MELVFLPGEVSILHISALRTAMHFGLTAPRPIEWNKTAQRQSNASPSHKRGFLTSPERATPHELSLSLPRVGLPTQSPSQKPRFQPAAACHPTVLSFWTLTFSAKGALPV